MNLKLTKEEIYNLNINNTKELKDTMSKLLDYFNLSLDSIINYDLEKNEFHLLRNDYLAFNDFLKELEIEKIPTIGFITLLRTSFGYKSKISEYNIFLEKSIEELKKRNLDSQSLLKGLI